ncbi:MAG: TetR family transcriptional regulator [Streptosporangiales bacterium]|nr:TetR family transcriptional regulator [Streptosporangiales bacterium]
MRLFLERGYADTTVADVAAAAEVSSMTVFRHFPTKEALVLTDDYDAAIVARIASRPAGEPLLRRILGSLADGVAELPEAQRALMLARVRLVRDTPALRARHWETQYQTRCAIVDGLLGEQPDPATRFRAQVAADAALAAASTAIFRWVDEDGATDLAELLREALAALTDEVAR